MSEAEPLSQRRRGNIPSERTVILFLPDGRTVLVTLHVLGIVDCSATSEKLVGELMNGRSPDAGGDAFNDVVTTRAWWRIRDCSMSMQLKVDKALAAKAEN